MKHWLWLLFLALPAFAQEATPPPGEDWERLRAEVRGLRGQADQMRSAAQQKVEAANVSCWEKFLVSACMDDAKKGKQQTERDAHKIDLEALAIERRVEAHDRQVKQEKRAAKFAEKDAKAARRAEATQLEDEARQRKLAEKAAKDE